MKKMYILILFMVIISAAYAQIPAFPGAQGAGAFSIGGRGGRVIEVTNLNNSGAGSLREACNATGPRIVVFKVCGTIQLTDMIVISSPFITIAGQTAPGDGITLSGANSIKNVLIVYDAHDVIIRYVRFRKGYNSTSAEQNGSSASIMQNSYNIIFDHCSFSWTQDENNTIWNSGTTAPPRKITFSWNVISEPLKAHPTSIITGGSNANNMVEIDFHHNLIANSSHRNPLIKNKSFRFINNIVYNWGYYATQQGGGAQVDVINNLYQPGPLTNLTRHEVQVFVAASSTTSSGTPSLYISGNIGPNNKTAEGENWNMVWEIASENALESTGKSLSTTYRRNLPLTFGGIPIVLDKAVDLEAKILLNVGAYQRINSIGGWESNRDKVDARIMTEYTARKGFIPNNEGEVGGFPVLACSTPYLDSDKDGMSNDWERRYCLNPNDATDGNKDPDNDGYTNVEEFLNGSGPSACLITDLDEHNFNQAFSISPNPAEREIYVHRNVSSSDQYHIYNIIGESVQEGLIEDGTIIIEKLNTGMYFVKIKVDTGEAVQMFIKK